MKGHRIGDVKKKKHFSVFLYIGTIIYHILCWWDKLDARVTATRRYLTNTET